MLQPSVINNQFKSLTPKRKFLMAYSGGLDSQVLLHLMAELRNENPAWQLRALHIHHGLSQHADAWLTHCENTCYQLDVPFYFEKINLNLKPGDSLEAQARLARREIFKKYLTDDECLLTAHHQNDQAETLLLQLLRGAGVHGLAAMAMNSDFYGFQQLRPLLNYSREVIMAYAKTQKLTWVEDESNVDQRFDRNFLRHEILPKLMARWPATIKNVARSAQHCGEAIELMDTLAQHDVPMKPANQLSLAALRKLTQPRQMNALRYFLRQSQFPLPSTKQLQQIRHDFLTASEDKQPHFAWQGMELRRYRDVVYLMPVMNDEVLSPTTWQLSQPLSLKQGNLQAKLTRGHGLNQEKIGDELIVRFREAGEIVALPLRGCKTLKNCWQEWGVPPWQRNRIPLLYHHDRLVAVVGYCICAGYEANANQWGWEVWCEGARGIKMSAF